MTSLAASSRVVVWFYSKRRTDDQWIKEGRQRVAMTRRSFHRFRANEAQLSQSLIAYNLGNHLRYLTIRRTHAVVDRVPLGSVNQVL